MSLIVSVPGKIHLLGEHAVVYGYPALLAAVGKRVYAHLKIKDQRSKIKNKENIIINTKEDDKVIRAAIDVFKKAYKIDAVPPIEITITSHLPTGSGLGSSASVAAVTIGALMKGIKNIWNPVRINELAYEVEKVAHGNPSGADNTAVVFGGLLWYRKEFEFLKSIWSLPIQQYTIPRFICIDSGKPVESTKEMVMQVGQKYNDKKIDIHNIFLDQEIQTKNILLSLREKNIESMQNALCKGEQNLEKIGVVGDFAKKIIRSIESEGGCAKISGAGGRKKGSGILLCFHTNLSVIEKIAKKYKCNYFQTSLGDEGIRIEKK